MKMAICQVADTGPLESLVVMLRAAGYTPHIPGDDIKRELREIKCDTVLDIKGLVENWGYDKPMDLPVATLRDMDRCDLYVEIKANRNGPKVWNRWPNLRDKTLWYRINGGEPEHVIRPTGEDCGDERVLLCPLLTPNLWYRDDKYNWRDKAYACWPPFYRWDNYFPYSGRKTPYVDPICLIHNATGWGYGILFDGMRSLGIKLHGCASPDGLINHREIPALLSKTKAMVHLKSSDAPGYALYEALAAACPVIVTRRLIWRNRMEELFEPDVTCKVFDVIGHQELTEEEIPKCVEEVCQALASLSTKEENERIGYAGRNRLQELMWNDQRDGDGFREFMARNFR